MNFHKYNSLCCTLLAICVMAGTARFPLSHAHADGEIVHTHHEQVTVTAHRHCHAGDAAIDQRLAQFKAGGITHGHVWWLGWELTFPTPSDAEDVQTEASRIAEQVTQPVVSNSADVGQFLLWMASFPSWQVSIEPFSSQPAGGTGASVALALCANATHTRSGVHLI